MERTFRNDLLTCAALVAAILLTRVEHFGTAFTPPDATLAAFFLGACWVRGRWTLPLLLAAAAAADQLAFAQGVSEWCVSPAYGFLVPAYGCLWLAGRAGRKLDWQRPRHLATGAAYLLSSALAAYVISSGSFFLFSGYFGSMSALEYSRAVSVYVPSYVGWTALYVGAFMLIREAARAAVQRHATSTG